MKKIISLLIVLTLVLSLTGCTSGRSPEEIGEYYVECLAEFKTAEFFKEYAGDLYLKLNESQFESRNQFIEYLQQLNEDSKKDNAQSNHSIEFVDSIIEKQYTKDEVKEYSKSYDENFKDIVIVKVTYNQLTNGQVTGENIIGLLLGKKSGKWEVTRFMSKSALEQIKWMDQQKNTGS